MNVFTNSSWVARTLRGAAAGTAVFAFLAAPQQTPDAQSIASMGPPEWVIP